MTSRITKKDLESALQTINKELAANFIPFTMISRPRNGYQAVDLYDELHGNILDNIEVGSSRECIAKCMSFSEYMFTSFYYTNKKVTRGSCKALCKNFGIDFSKDPLQLSSDERGYLLELAKKTKYYKSKNSASSLSRASLFFCTSK